MKNIKGTLSCIVLITFFISHSHILYATQPDTQKLLEQAGAKILELENGTRYKEIIDTAMTKKDEKTLLEMSQKIFEIKKRKDIIKHSKITTILHYLELKLDSAIISMWEEIDTYIKPENIPSEYEKAEVENTIIEIQKGLVKKASLHTDTLIQEIHKFTNYEEKWDLKINFLFQESPIGDIETEFQLKDYNAKTSLLDSQITGKLETIFSADSEQWQSINIEFESIIDFLSKNGNMFLHMKNLDIIDWQWMDIIQTYLEKIAEFWEENKYISLQNSNAESISSFLETISHIKNLTSDTTLWKAFFTPYKKEDDRYILIPTKHACNTMKKILSPFDPFHWDTCSDAQYEEMKEKIDAQGTLSLKLWQETQILFEWTPSEQIEKIQASMIWNGEEINQIQAEIVPYQPLFPEEWLTLNYKKYESLSFTLFADGGNIDYQLWGILDSNNQFHVINFSWTQHFPNISLLSNFSLNNKKITGNIRYSDKKYEAGSYKENITLELTLDGEVDNNNDISSITLNLTWTNQETKNVFESGTLEYQHGSLNINNTYRWEGTNSDMELSTEWDTQNKTFKNGSFSFSLDQREWQYNFETFEFEYAGDYENILSLELQMQNQTITGSTSISSWNDEKIVDIRHSGTYGEHSVEWNNNFEVYIPLLQNAQNNITGDLNIKVDAEDRKNDAEVHFEARDGENIILQLKLENTGTREHKNVEIQTPNLENQVPLQEVFSQIQIP